MSAVYLVTSPDWLLLLCREQSFQLRESGSGSDLLAECGVSGSPHLHSEVSERFPSQLESIRVNPKDPRWTSIASPDSWAPSELHIPSSGLLCRQFLYGVPSLLNVPGLLVFLFHFLWTHFRVLRRPSSR